MTQKPKPYSPTDTKERDEIRVLKLCLDPFLVKDNLTSNDKTPNIDGTLELVDKDQYPIGRFDVQIKALAKKYEKDPKISIDLSFFSYSKSIHNPILFIVVDCKKRIAYWEYFSIQAVISLLDSKTGQKTHMIHFNKRKQISPHSTNYYKDWKLILSQRKIVENVKINYDIDASFNVQNESILKIQNFLDEFNYLIEKDFVFVKNKIFPQTWKVGLYLIPFKFSDKEAYSFFGIPNGNNDILIKIMNDGNYDSLLGNHGGVWSGNIKKDPKKSAMHQVFQLIEEIFEDGMIDFTECPLLIIERIYSYLDENAKDLSIHIKDQYSISDCQSLLKKKIQQTLTNEIYELPEEKKYLDWIEKLKIYGYSADSLIHRVLCKKQNRSRICINPPNLIKNIELIYLNGYNSIKYLLKSLFSGKFDYFIQNLYGGANIIVVNLEDIRIKKEKIELILLELHILCPNNPELKIIVTQNKNLKWENIKLNQNLQNNPELINIEGFIISKSKHLFDYFSNDYPLFSYVMDNFKALIEDLKDKFEE